MQRRVPCGGSAGQAVSVLLQTHGAVRKYMETGSGAGRIVDLYGGISDTAWKKTGSSVCVDGRTYNRTCKRESVCTNQGRKKPFLRKISVESGYVAGKTGGGQVKKTGAGEREEDTLIVVVA